MTRTMLASVLLLAACSDEPGVSVMMPIGTTAPAYGTVPFPTDAVRDGDRLGAIPGLEGMAGNHRDLALAHIATLDGFGMRPLVEFFLDGDLARDAIPDGAAGVIDVDPASPERGRVIPMEWRYEPARRVIAGVPATGMPLLEGTRYAAYVTTAVGATRMSTLGTVPARWQTTADAVAELDRDDLAGITVFTTQHASQPLLDALTAQQAAEPPALAFDRPEIIFAGTTALDRTFGQATRATTGARAGLERWGFDNPTGVAHDHVGVVGTGTMTVVRFRGDDTRTDGPEDETFSSPPAPRGIEEIPITFIIPAAPPPATGYPLVIYGHGLGQSRELALTFAEPLTSRGFAVVAIDMVGHGSRFDATDVVANMSAKSQFTGVAEGPDGFPDKKGLTATLDFFENFLGVSAVRDGLRQSALDLCRVSQLLRRPDLDLSALAGPGGVPVLDASRTSYMADSFGTVVGTVFAAIEPDIDLYVFDVPGGGILDRILVESPEISAIAVSLITTLYNPNPDVRFDRWHPFLNLMQAVLDGGDPLTYAPHVTRDRFPDRGPRSIIALEVMGDQVLPNTGTIALAQALELDVLAPYIELPAGLSPIDSPAAGNRPDGQTAVLVQYAPATHGGNWGSEHGWLRYDPTPDPTGEVTFRELPAPIRIANPIYETLDQVLGILETHRDGGPPRVQMTKPPVLDFDGDGTPDATDPAPLDPAQ